MNKIRKGDEVIVLAGRDKGKRGKVTLRKDDSSCAGRGHQPGQEAHQAQPDQGYHGGIVEKAMPIHQSNVAIYNAARARLIVSASNSWRRQARARLQVQRRRNQGGMTMARLQQHYREKVAPELMAKFGYKSPMQVPRLTKITLNMGVSEAVADKKVMDNAVADLTKIAGQKPVVTKSKKAIAGFKIREGQAIGCMVTLRGVQMFEFLDRFVTVALPRVRDFRGISGRAFDGRGNYNIGVKEQIIFPEIEYDKVDALRGLNISITTTAKTDEECKALLAGFRFPFKN
jgi:large subunit ribosomal protein L5